jgi:PEP-CTERM motif
MKLIAFTIVLGMLLCVLPAKADEFADARVATTIGNATDSEHFDLAVEFDNTTQTLLADGVQTSAFGSLGAFNFAGFTVAPPQGQLGNGYLFAWKDLIGDTMTLSTVDESAVQPGHWAKFAAFAGPNVAGWDFSTLPAYSGGFTDPPPSPTPEPSSLILLGLGLISAVFMSRRLLTS